MFYRKISFLNRWRFLVWYIFKVKFILILHKLVTSVLINLSTCCVVTSSSMSSSPPSIIMIHWRVRGFFYSGKLIGSQFNWSLGVDDSIHIFIRCDYQTGRGDMLAKHIDHCSLMNCSLVKTSREGSLDCYVAIFFFSPSWTSFGFGESIGISLSDKGNWCCKQGLYN